MIVKLQSKLLDSQLFQGIRMCVPFTDPLEKSSWWGKQVSSGADVKRKRYTLLLRPARISAVLLNVDLKMSVRQASENLSFLGEQSSGIAAEQQKEVFGSSEHSLHCQKGIKFKSSTGSMLIPAGHT
jgi:hypothetical protein